MCYEQPYAISSFVNMQLQSYGKKIYDQNKIGDRFENLTLISVSRTFVNVRVRYCLTGKREIIRRIEKKKDPGVPRGF